MYFEWIYYSLIRYSFEKICYIICCFLAAYYVGRKKSCVVYIIQRAILYEEIHKIPETHAA